MSGKIFDVLIINGRPAAGKSEILDYLKKTPLDERIERFHVGELEEFDDFPILWEGFENDNIFEKHGKERLMSNTHFEFKGKTCKWYIFKDLFYWHFLIEKLCFNYSKKIKANPDYHKNTTAIFEFSRGTHHGGWTEAYNYLYDEVLKNAATMYIDVTYEESLSKNRKRFITGKEDSILHHTMADMYMEYVYKGSDWTEFSGKDPKFLSVKNQKVPFSVFENMPDKTKDAKALGTHLEEVLHKLWDIKRG